MTILNPVAYCRNLWDWACLDGCFGQSRISPTDIDGTTEHNGYFLWIETKEPGKPVPLGQRRYFANLVQDMRHTVIIAWGLPQKPIKLMWLDFDGPLFADPATLDDLRFWVTHWYSAVHAKPPLKISRPDLIDWDAALEREPKGQ